MKHSTATLLAAPSAWAWVLRAGAVLLLLVAVATAIEARRVSAATGTVTLSLMPSATSVQPGDTVTVSIVMDAGNVPLTSIQTRINIDPSRFQVVLTCSGVPVTSSPSVGDWVVLLNQHPAATDQIRFAGGIFSPSTSGITGSLTLGTFQLWVKASVPTGSASVSMLTGLTADNTSEWTAALDLDDTYHQLGAENLVVNPATVTIGAGPAVTTSAPSPDCGSSTTTSPPPSTSSGGTSSNSTAASSTTTAASTATTTTAVALPAGVVGATGSTQAVTVSPSRIRLTSTTTSEAVAEVDVGTISKTGEVTPLGFLRDGDLGQTYAIVKRESDGLIVRVWVSPTSPLRFLVPWSVVNSQLTLPVDVISALPLDEQYPQPGQLARRFDGGDDRIFYYDGSTSAWRHIPDIATFQSVGAYWCDVTSADNTTFSRMTIGPPLDPSPIPPRSDYPSCRTS